MEFLVLYLFVMLEQLTMLFSKSAGALLLFILCFGFAMGIGWLAIADSRGSKAASEAVGRWKWIPKLCIPAMVLCFFISHLLPTPKQAAVIFGGGLAYQAVTSDKGQEVLGKVGSKVEHELVKLLSIPDENVGAAKVGVNTPTNK